MEAKEALLPFQVDEDVTEGFCLIACKCANLRVLATQTQ